MRSLENLEFVLDIILNERLYCSDFASLNDPLEGIYFSIPVPYFPNGLSSKNKASHVSQQTLTQLSEYKNFSRVCSLALSFEDIRLWSHYADSHRGVAIEIDFIDYETDVKQIEYLLKLKRYRNTTLETPFPDEILSKKTIHWEHEKEFRIIQSDTYYAVPGRISAIYLGSRVDGDRKILLDKILPNNLPIYCTKINESHLAVVSDGLLQRKPK